MTTLKLTEEEKSLLLKALNYQMVDVAFMDSFKGSNQSNEKRNLIKLIEKIDLSYQMVDVAFMDSSNQSNEKRNLIKLIEKIDK